MGAQTGSNGWERFAAGAETSECVLVQTGLSEGFARALLFVGPDEVLRPRNAAELEHCLRRVEEHTAAGRLAAGYFNFEAGYALEAKLAPLLRASEQPLAWIGIYDGAEELELPLEDGNVPGLPLEAELRFGLDTVEYSAKTGDIQRWIAAGDVYQINFTDSFAIQAPSSASTLFRVLLARHPVEHAAFLNTGERQIISISPELFFERSGARIVVKPMKGTAARGRTTAEDLRQAAWLQESEKDRAENLMIVDLMRNDLGRIARAGSVQVPSLFSIEKYASVFQITSRVETELAPSIGYREIIHAMFPSGSVTGAPKIRAMELISELERAPRGAYTGSIGYFARDHAKLNVAIRTLEFTGAQGRMGAGSGIVADSVASEELRECHAKAAFLQAAGESFSILESMLWNGEFRHLEAHLRRMADSANYFNFHWNEDAAREALACCDRKKEGVPGKVRLLLYRSGIYEATFNALSSVRRGRVGIADTPVNSSDRFLFHKTTRRGLYDRALAAAQNAEYDDLLFFNKRGELTEGTIHNVFLEMDGCLLTPPINSGLLAGIERQFILQSDPRAREQVLFAADLARAERIYLCNSVRGLYAVEPGDQVSIA